MSAPSSETPAIRVEGLDVWFGADRDRMEAVRGATFSVPEGGSFGLVGESGSGKSTILRAIAGLAPTWSGGLRVLGNDQVGARRDRAFHRSVQMVFQDPYGSLHPRHSVDRVLSEPLRRFGFDDLEGRIERVLRDVGLDHRFRFRYPHQISGGQRQRVALARALVLEPRILLLDEPTSALDVSVQAEILNLLADLKAARGLTYLMVSHDLAVVAHLCAAVAVMTEGEVVETLSVERMRRLEAGHPYTQRLFEASQGFQPCP